ncbi:hypothetical protein K4A83_20250 [Spirulina subsalsa FACHB-351]|uniref:Uncharacterized protein n=1 Tax=Spirulina subsalsa FACHB-351 TaxID=234711 RepID=A0ABT3LAQ0_9CYAN|nr:hypothetical protein [Spirulina subsalsa]MCW6038586.1 hypothetical protein [Spirulina subsalsa FACHB-351]
MGRKAKLKKTRSITPPPPPPSPTQFVKQLNQQGYQFNQIQHSPELPDSKPEPEV